MEPNAVEGVEKTYVRYGLLGGDAGGIGLQMKFQIHPLSVSFARIEIEEIPSSIGLQNGYFDHPYFDNERYHSTLRGAGVWACLNGNNVALGVDTAAIDQSLPRMTPGGQMTDNPEFGWCAGSNLWSVPFGWKDANAPTNAPHYGAFAAGETQEFVIDLFGNVEVRKMRHVSRRDILNDVYLDGVLQ